MVAVAEGDDGLFERIHVRGAFVDDIAPALEAGDAIGDGDAFVVGDVVDDAAEGVEGVHVLAAFFRETGESEGEVRPAFAHNGGGGGGGRIVRHGGSVKGYASPGLGGCPH